MIQKVYLIIREVAGGRLISLIVLLAVALSVFSVGLFRATGDGLVAYVRDRFASSIPPNTVRISMKQPRSLFLFETDGPKKPAITDRTIGKIRAMAGVIGIVPVSSLRIPVQARVSYLGFKYRSDLLAFGVPYRLVANELAGERYRRLWLHPAREKIIPVLVPRTILRSYNDGMAGPNGLPRISERGAVGFGFSLLMGKSSLRTLPGYEEAEAVIAGFTDQVDSFALILPLDLVTGYNRKYIQEHRNEYQYAYVNVRDHAALLAIVPRIKALGLVVETGKGVSRQILSLTKTILLVSRSLQAVVLLLALIAVSFATVIATMSRVEYYRILRIIGASRLFLTAAIMAKYALLGLGGAWAGSVLLRLAAGSFAEHFRLTGIMVPIVVPDDSFRMVLLIGAMIPVLSALPALLRLYFKGLSQD
jgi:hypothetical protein